jgi:hypothetical protein
MDRSYSLTDAVFISQNSSNPESDSGLTEDMDPEDAQTTMAAYTFSNDAWAEAEVIYNKISEVAEDAEADVEIDDRKDIYVRDGKAFRDLLVRHDGDLTISAVFDNEDELNFEHVVVAGPFLRTVVTKENIDTLDNLSSATKSVVKVILDNDGEPSYDELRQAFRSAVAQAEIATMIKNSKPEPIEPGSEEERRELLEWLRAGRNSSRGGYPLGGSYIDARCGHEYGTPEHAYVSSDNELGARLPHLRGKYARDVKAYWDETYGGPAPTTAEEMLAKVRRMIRDGAENAEFREITEEIDGILTPDAPRV